jgi:hypothetical protein
MVVERAIQTGTVPIILTATFGSKARLPRRNPLRLERRFGNDFIARLILFHYSYRLISGSYRLNPG